MKVQCKRCKTEYVFPDGLSVIPVMDDCPICKDIEKVTRKVLDGLFL